MRNLLLFLLALFAIWWVRRALRKPGEGGGAAPGSDAERGGRRVTSETIRECAHCGLLVPESEGVQSGGAFFCCEEHRRLGARS